MAIPDLPILSMLRTRMQWHQERQRVLAENVANAETPRYPARDLAPPNFTSTLQQVSIGMARTDPGHIDTGRSHAHHFREYRQLRIDCGHAARRPLPQAHRDVP